MAVTESQSESSCPAYNRTLLCHLDRGTKCHIQSFLEHFQGQGLHHLPVQFQGLITPSVEKRCLYLVEFLQTGICREWEGPTMALTLSPRCGHPPRTHM